MPIEGKIFIALNRVVNEFHHQDDVIIENDMVDATFVATKYPTFRISVKGEKAKGYFEVMLCLKCLFNLSP